MVSEDGYREEFHNDLAEERLELLPPDLWQLHWSLTTPARREIYTEIIAALPSLE